MTPCAIWWAISAAFLAGLAVLPPHSSLDAIDVSLAVVCVIIAVRSCPPNSPACAHATRDDGIRGREMSDVGWARDIADVAMNDGGYSYIEREALRVIAAVRAEEREACAKIIDDHAEAIAPVIALSWRPLLRTGRRHLIPRSEGDFVATAYAAAIRARSAQ